MKIASASRHYNYFRDYDPATGGYTQSDPIGLRGGLNTFAYVHRNPVMAVDPRGLDGAVRIPGAIPGFLIPDVVFPTTPANDAWVRSAFSEIEALNSRPSDAQ